MSIRQKFIRWWNSDDEIDLWVERYTQSQRQFNQSQFLLESAPMIQAPERSEALRFSAPSSPYGFINSRTLVAFSGFIPEGKYWTFPGSPTKWLSTPLMPEGRILMTRLPIPFLGETKR